MYNMVTNQEIKEKVMNTYDNYDKRIELAISLARQAEREEIFRGPSNLLLTWGKNLPPKVQELWKYQQEGRRQLAEEIIKIIDLHGSGRLSRELVFHDIIQKLQKEVK